MGLRYTKKSISETQIIMDEMGYTISIASITRIFRAWENGEDLHPEKSSGRPPIFNPKEKKDLKAKFIVNPGISVL